MMRAILAGGGVALIGGFAASLWIFSLGPSGRTAGQLTINEVLTLGIAALLGGIGSLYFARRLPPASWITTIVGWIVGFFGFPMVIDVALPILLAISK
jgi:hypothetical protein